MDPFIHRLIERLLDDSHPLSRNRHFHTFATPEGKRALRLSRRLKALAHDIGRCAGDGGVWSITREADQAGEIKVELRLLRLKTSRVTTLDPAEFELLCRLPGVREALATQE
jgi:hypothetical protein